MAEKKSKSWTAPKDVYKDFEGDEEELVIADKTILGRESDYQKQRLNRTYSPTRKDAFSKSSEGASYSQVMMNVDLDNQKKTLLETIQKKAVEITTKKSEWEDDDNVSVKSEATTATGVSHAKRNRWDETPTDVGSQYGVTPRGSVSGTPKRSRWDQTPVATPRGYGLSTPLRSDKPDLRWEKELDGRNRYLTDAELDLMLPLESDGYKIVPVPKGYVPISTPARKLAATPTPTTGFSMQDEKKATEGASLVEETVDYELPTVEGLQFFKSADMQYFGKIMDDKEDKTFKGEALKERTIMRLLLNIKNGTPIVRKQAMKDMTLRAREFGAAPLFNQILPILMSPSLVDQERHLMVKVLDRVLFKLDDLVRPFVHKILVVIEPLLIDEDFYARVEGREIISNLSKAAGLATMIATMRPDIDHVDEFVRNTTARAFSVVSSALGVPALLPFLKAVCHSKKSWQARHTGIKIIQQIAILMGCGVLPHLKPLVEAIGHGLEDEQPKVRTITALAIAALAEASSPYGIEAFDTILRPLWMGVKKHRGKGLAAFLKAIGFIIPLMDPEYANYYTKEVMLILVREFSTPDDEMKKIVLKVIKQCISTEGVDPSYIKDEIAPDYFRYFWVRRMALDRRASRQLVETTVEIAHKIGVHAIIVKVIEGLKDESEAFRKMVTESIEKIVASLGSADLDDRIIELMLDGLLYAFQEQVTDESIILDAFETVVTSLGLRVKKYLPQIVSTILWRLNNKASKVRQQAADLTSKVAVILKTCGEDKSLAQLGVVLYEFLGEEYPEVLGSILKALKSIVNVVGMSTMTPPIKDLLPRLTPILKNRHEKVQENCIDLVGRIADRGAEFVSAREWMRICFELLDMLKAHKKGIRRACVNTFGYIAKAIGPQDVLATLLNNLKVQERNMKVCTTVAIAIVAETCAPFTVLPALMNEYRVPENGVQNGVLKSIAFLFEYIGEMGKDYIWAITPLLEDALCDIDLCHRQTSCTAIKHIAVGVAGLGCDDCLHHLLNFVWPNIFETSPHVITAVLEAIDGLRVGVGPAPIALYCFQGLFHASRRIYNLAYLGNQDALVPIFPRIENEGENIYERHELGFVV